MANPEHVQILKQGSKAWNDWRTKFPSITPDLSGDNFRYTVLRDVDLSNTNFSGSDLRDINLRRADLTNALLVNVKLYRSYVSNARLYQTNFRRAVLYETVFADVDLSTALYLDTCVHKGPSVIDQRTLARSKELPIEFLRGCGLPDFIINETTPQRRMSQYRSCFISYSSKDQDFAEQLYSDLQNNGVRCWFAPEDLKIGEKIRNGIDDSIRKHDKLLIVLSEQSVTSGWVEHEVEAALAREREEKKLVLYPIRLDDVILSIKSGWPSLIKNTRNIGDFREWREHSSYQRALKRLLRDLETDDSGEANA